MRPHIVLVLTVVLMIVTPVVAQETPTLEPPTVTPIPTEAPSAIPTETFTPEPSATSAPLPTFTEAPSSTPSQTETATLTVTETETAMVNVTATETVTATASHTAGATASSTASVTATVGQEAQSQIEIVPEAAQVCNPSAALAIASVGPGGVQGNIDSQSGDVTSDGRYIAYTSLASNLVAGDTNNVEDVFVYDRLTCGTVRASVKADGTQGDRDSTDPAISDDGRYITFTSISTTLGTGMTETVNAVYLKDLQTGTLSLIEIIPSGDGEPTISDDGRFVAYSALVVSGGAATISIKVYDRQTGQLTTPVIAAKSPVISGNGQVIAFRAVNPNQIFGDVNFREDAFVYEVQTGQITRVSVASNGTVANGDTYFKPSISTDGRYVAFSSRASNLVPNDTNGVEDVFVHDRFTGQTTRVSVASNGQQARYESKLASISGDGRYISFTSGAPELANGLFINNSATFVYDRQSALISSVSVDSNGFPGVGTSLPMSMSGNGGITVFISDVSSLVPGDTNNSRDVFVAQTSMFAPYPALPTPVPSNTPIPATATPGVVPTNTASPISCSVNITAGDTAGLISAINTANANSGADVICLGAGTYAFNTINNVDDHGDGNALPLITSDITIHGAVGQTTTLTRPTTGGTPHFRFLQVDATGSLTLQGLNVTNGLTDVPDALSRGGAVYNLGTLIVTNSTFRNNSSGLGGAIHNARNLILESVEFSNNVAMNRGGAVYSGNFVATPAQATITNSHFTANQVISEFNGSGYGGAINNHGILTITGSIFTKNTSSAEGGSIFATDLGPSVNVTNSCFQNNRNPSVYTNGARPNFANNWWGFTGGTGGYNDYTEGNLITSPYLTSYSSPYCLSVTDRYMRVPTGGTNTLTLQPVGGTAPYTYQILAQPTNGTVGNTAFPELRYTANSGFGGQDFFVYQITDASGLKAVAYVRVNSDLAPDRNYSTLVNTPLDIHLGNPAPHQFQGITAPAHGTLTGTLPLLTYTGNPGYSGQDSFTYTVITSDGYVDSGTVNILIAAPSPTPVITLIVNTTNDLVDGAGCDVSHCSLREAVNTSNNLSGLQRIEFNIPGVGPHRIVIGSSLVFTSSAYINGFSQPNLTTRIEIVPLSSGVPYEGFVVNGANPTIYDPNTSVTIIGLAINSFAGPGILLGNGQGHVILDNLIGTDATGTQARGNDTGIIVRAPNSTIQNNLISGNLNDGIYLYSNGGRNATNNQILGNLIGTDITGSSAIPNNRGIRLDEGAANNTIGGIELELKNTISGNRQEGIYIGGSTSNSNRIIGNLIGLTASAEYLLGNGGTGIFISGAQGTIIGLQQAGGGNDIYDNLSGINLANQANSTTIQNNLVLLSRTDGIIVNGSNNLISRNAIAYNSNRGIVNHAGTGNRLTGNSIFGNTGMGIDLGTDADVTQNDAGDGDSGANNLQNFPVINSAGEDRSFTQVAVTFNSTPNTTYQLEFFGSPVCDANGYGEGETSLSTLTVQTDSSGNAAFSGLVSYYELTGTFGSNWVGTFFPSNNLTGTGIPVGGINGLDFYWGFGWPVVNGVAVPGIIGDNFSARFTSVQYFLGETYRFIAESDDGIRIYIDGTVVFDRFVTRNFTRETFDVALTEGNHTLTVEYFEGTGEAQLHLQWLTSNTRKHITAIAIDPNGNTSEFSACQIVQPQLPTVTPSPTATLTPTPPSNDAIFADGFESGNFAFWSTNSNDLGDLSVTTTAAMVGARGMQAVVDDTVSLWARDETPNAEKRYRARFYFNPNGLTMANDNRFILLYGYQGAGTTAVAQIEMRYFNGSYQLRGGSLNDATAWTFSNWITFSNGQHFVEFDWRAATVAGANDGVFALWLDGILIASFSNIDNDTRVIDRIHLGTASGLDAGTTGTMYFDDFVSRRFTYIGPDAGTIPTATLSPMPTVTNTPIASPTMTYTLTQPPTFTATPTALPTMSYTPTLRPTWTLTPTSTLLPNDAIFADGFESANFAFWSTNSNDIGDLSVTTTAAMVGGRGMQAVVDDNISLWVRDETPNAEKRYRARFYFNPNNITMANDERFILLYGYMAPTYNGVLQLEMRYFNGSYQLRGGALNDANIWTLTNWVSFSNATHFVEFDWRAATVAEANDGVFTLWLDGIQIASFSNIDNDTRVVDRIHWGTASGIDAGTRGTMYFDDFVSRRFSYIGPAGGSPPTSTPTLTPTPTTTGFPTREVSPPPTPTLTVTRTPTPSPTPTVPTATPPSNDAIFSDSFESGYLSVWSTNSNDAGDLSITTVAGMVGAWGLHAVVDDSNSLWVRDETPNAEKRYRARFYFNPNNITMANDDRFILLYGYMAPTYSGVLQLEMRYFNGSYQLRGGTLNDANLWTLTNWVSFSNATHFVEFDWRAATVAGANDGVFALWLDGILIASFSNIDNDTRVIDRIHWGTASGIDAGTRGTMYFDDFVSRRFSYIGGSQPAFTPTPTGGGGCTQNC